MAWTLFIICSCGIEISAQKEINIEPVHSYFLLIYASLVSNLFVTLRQFLLFLGYLYGYHIRLVINNQTTHERLKELKTWAVSPNEKGSCLRNASARLWRRLPSFVGPLLW